MATKGKQAGDGIVGSFVAGGTEYVIVPKAEYLRSTRGLPAGSVDAGDFIRKSIAASMRAARERAGLSQEELAKKIRKSQPMVSGVEAGRIAGNERYVKAVLRACGLPADWKGA